MKQINPFEARVYLEHAKEFYSECNISNDALFIGFCIMSMFDAPPLRPVPTRLITSGLQKVIDGHSGKSITASQAHKAMHGKEASISEAREMAAWLRGVGMRSRRAGGRIVFDIG